MTTKQSRLGVLFGVKDMTVGSPLSLMLLFSLPLLIGNVAQMLYTVVDGIILGNMINKEALAAVGVSAAIQQPFNTFFMAVGVGATVMVSQYFGAKDKERLSLATGTSLVLTLVVTVFITVVGIPVSGFFLEKTNAGHPGELLFDYAKQYLQITFAGAIGLGFYNILSGILRGLGDAIFPFVVLVATSLLHIALDFLFVGPFRMGVAGAAWSTFIAQYVSAAACLWRLMRMKSTLEVSRRTLRPNKAMAVQIIKIALPAGIMQWVLSAAALFVQSLINSIHVVSAATGLATNTIFLAANTAVTRIDGLANLPSQAFSMVGSTFAGQNIGAGRLDRVKQGFRIIFTLSMAVELALFILIYIFAPELVKMFISTSDPDAQTILELGTHVVRINVWNFLIMVIVQSTNGVIRGAGDTIAVMIFTLIATVGVRIPVAYIWVMNDKSAMFPNGGPDGVFWSMVIGFSVAAALCMIYYLSGRWKRKAVVNTVSLKS
ncbi:MAG: MATE family efflux transporter [Oscillospiraceae bacterium]|jgi:putative MATE family efflux protein|nr:MATE family efflux transporter [Oscillospiraceae bacterium]